ncbi:MAG TPA: ketopantoate reductase family protein [Azospirillaceae bacterium]|nr:ketopantoate reductase family protein [Azospirillaceae bacterium]
MRILILGAGATGGYFGGRLMEAGENVTFLVRPKRQQQLRETGLVVLSPKGDIRLPAQTVTRIAKPYDLVLLSAKAYDLDSAVEAIRPAVGEGTLVLPLLNGLAHLERLDAALGAGRVLGGLCNISVTLEPDGTIRHLPSGHKLIFGARYAAQEAGAAAAMASLGKSAAEVIHSPDILQDMWEKWVMLATLAGGTCLMRGGISDILTAGGEGFLLGLLEECRSVAAAEGRPPREAAMAACAKLFTDRAEPMVASMLRDIRRGGATEGEHVLGDLVRRAKSHGVPVPRLESALLHVRTYEALRAKEEIKP